MQGCRGVLPKFIQIWKRSSQTILNVQPVKPVQWDSTVHTTVYWPVILIPYLVIACHYASVRMGMQGIRYFACVCVCVCVWISPQPLKTKQQCKYITVIISDLNLLDSWIKALFSHTCSISTHPLDENNYSKPVYNNNHPVLYMHQDISTFGAFIIHCCCSLSTAEEEEK